MQEGHRLMQLACGCPPILVRGYRIGSCLRTAPGRAHRVHHLTGSGELAGAVNRSPGGAQRQGNPLGSGERA